LFQSCGEKLFIKIKLFFLTDFGLLVLATGISGVLSYLLNILVRREVNATDFVEFAVFWGAIYLGVGILSGIQQEVTRAVSGDKHSSKIAKAHGSAPSTVALLGILFSALMLSLIFFFFLEDDFFGISNYVSGLIIFLGLSGYVIVAIYSGLLYGAHNAVRVVAVMICSDAIIRFAAVLFVAVSGYSNVLMQIAIALPFVLVPVFVTPLLKRFVSPGIRMDVSPLKFSKNALMTMAAAGAMAFLISGFPLILKLMLSDVPIHQLASLIFVVTLSRAPLIIVAMSLQSFLISVAMKKPDSSSYFKSFYLFISLAAIIIGFILTFAGDQLFTHISGSRVDISFVSYFAIGISSGIIGILFVAGARLLAADEHVKYLLMWLFAAFGTLVFVFVPIPPETRLVCALVIPPLLGLGIYSLSRPRKIEQV
jgi:O-antigen/teichoic acid export membrane protein